MIKLKELREFKNITQKDLSEKLELSRTSYNGYEKGKVEPDIQTLIKFADYYDVSLDYLCGRETKTTQLPPLNEEQKKIMQMIIALNRDNFGIAFGVIMGLYQKQMYQSI